MDILCASDMACECRRRWRNEDGQAARHFEGLNCAGCEFQNARSHTNPHTYTGKLNETSCVFIVVSPFHCKIVWNIFNRIPVCQHFYLLLLHGAVTTNILTPVHDKRSNDFVVDDVKNVLWPTAWTDAANCIVQSAIRAKSSLIHRAKMPLHLLKCALNFRLHIRFDGGRTPHMLRRSYSHVEKEIH